MDERPDFLELLDGRLYLVRDEGDSWQRVQQGTRYLLCTCDEGRQGHTCPHKQKTAAYQREKDRRRCAMPVSVMRAAGVPSGDIIKWLDEHAAQVGPLTEQRKG